MEELKVGDVIKERYALIRFLGSGSFGEVWLAHDQLTGRDVALKIYLSLDPAGVEEFQREYSNTIDLSSQYLLTPGYLDVYGRRPYLVMRYCENGSSSKLAGNITEEQLWQFVHDVAEGLAVLHGQPDPIVHQDIKPDNILVDKNGHFLITDFGISRRLRATMRRQSKRDVNSGAMPYMAPERFESNPRLSTASDIWSLGASIYELATGELPFNGFGGAMQRNGAEMPSLPSTYTESLNTLMQGCMSLDENNRPSVSQLLKLINHRYNNVDNNNNITNYNIKNPELITQLNIDGRITPVIIQPRFDEWVFSGVWYSVINLFFVLFTHSIDNMYIYLVDIAILCPLAMWIIGYILVKKWNPIGRYLMCGAIYLFFIYFLILFIYGLIEYINKFLNIECWCWYDYLKLIYAGVIVCVVIILFCSLIAALMYIKSKNEFDPNVWIYNGKKLLPIFYEFILPTIVLLLFIFTKFFYYNS